MTSMEHKEIESYEAPSVLTVEVKTAGIICQSGERDNYPGYEI